MRSGGYPSREAVGAQESDDEISLRFARPTAPIPILDSIELIAGDINQSFNQLNHTLSHTLILASSNDLLKHALRDGDTRFIPSAWGIRQDNYQRTSHNGRDDVIAFRNAATEIAKALVTRPIPAWSDLLPGQMTAVMGQVSYLYLPDYWVLVLHHLVWTKRLPYPIKAKWVQGSSIHDEVFYFTSEIPVDLAEASKDALILFKEAATQSLVNLLHLPDDAMTTQQARGSTEPPVCVGGRWQQPKRDTTPNGNKGEPIEEQTESETPNKPHEDQGQYRGDENDRDSDHHFDQSNIDPSDDRELDHNSLAPTNHSLKDGSLNLDDQRFIVRLNGCEYPFTRRNKQLFALLERINRRPGHRVDFDVLRSVGDVWDGAHVEDSTIRGAVTRLRRVLRHNGLASVAKRIVTGTYQNNPYIVFKHNDSADTPG